MVGMRKSSEKKCQEQVLLEAIQKLIYYTVKLGYKELGNNKLLVIANICFQSFQSQIYVYHIMQLGYNEFRL